MKYLLLLTILLSCESGPRKVTAYNDRDTTIKATVKHNTAFTATHDPFDTGKDTVRLNKVINKILKFPEVKAITKLINTNSKGKHSTSIMVRDEFNGDTTYYQFMVGDNSHEDRYVNIFNFLMDKKTEQIKAYDPALDSIMNLQDWRRSRK